MTSIYYIPLLALLFSSIFREVRVKRNWRIYPGSGPGCQRAVLELKKVHVPDVPSDRELLAGTRLKFWETDTNQTMGTLRGKILVQLFDHQPNYGVGELLTWTLFNILAKVLNENEAIQCSINMMIFNTISLEALIPLPNGNVSFIIIWRY